MRLVTVPVRNKFNTEFSSVSHVNPNLNFSDLTFRVFTLVMTCECLHILYIIFKVFLIFSFICTSIKKKKKCDSISSK